ncbi:MFS transporter [Nocardia sp. NBC_01503]|uniref:MFS transporter n=1 Tax=Nocardia sp. NBC_01503 TaxID=2975997 RepID=UPI002E7ADEAA|nr:MFS transporter [Nocardia sp. NBC_01503]WTL33323.1 MFS transporter [Nocardia sp. NBC_01503]
MTQSLTKSPPTVAAPAVAGSSRRSLAILAVILLGQFMAVIDASIVNVAIPAMRTSLHASGSGLQLIVSGYVIAYAVLLVTGARLGDRFGQRTMFLTGLALFTIASLACGLAWNTPVLIIFRFLQGIGSAAMIPQVMTLIQREFTGNTRARALSAYAAVISGGMVVGQILGGLIVSADLAGTSWRGVFLVNVPIGLVLLAVAPAILPVTVRTERKLDLAGLAVLTPAVLLLVVPLVLGHEQDWPVWTWIALAAAAAGFVGFLRVERWVHKRGGAPLFADQVLRAPGLILTAATLFTVMCTFGGWLFVMAIHLQSTLGYTALHAGLLFLPMGITFALASLNWQRIPERLHATMIPAGLVLAAVTMVIMGLLLRDGADFGPLELTVFGIMGIGFGLSFSPLMARTTGKIPLALAADASGILVTNVQLGTVVGIASFGSVFLSLAGSTTVSASHAVGITAIVEGVTVLAASVLAARAAR